jgi:hypothetical protein
VGDGALRPAIGNSSQHSKGGATRNQLRPRVRHQILAVVRHTQHRYNGLSEHSVLMMAMSSEQDVLSRTRFEQAIARFDAANAEDRNKEREEGREFPKELLYAQRMSAMLERFAPEASEALRLAVRCQHICRWKIPRTDYPMTTPGYKQWRAQLMRFHAELAGGILREVGYDEAMIGRVQSLLRKKALKVNPETQTLEDVIGLVFLESYSADFVRSHSQYDEAKLEEILRKILRKMSRRGREASLSLIRLPRELLPVIHKASGPDAGRARS